MLTPCSRRSWWGEFSPFFCYPPIVGLKVLHCCEPLPAARACCGLNLKSSYPLPRLDSLPRRVQVVAVIPVIGKSDSMTVDEMKDFKTVIMELAAGASDLDFFEFSGGSHNSTSRSLPGNTTSKWQNPCALRRKQILIPIDLSLARSPSTSASYMYLPRPAFKRNIEQTRRGTLALQPSIWKVHPSGWAKSSRRRMPSSQASWTIHTEAFRPPIQHAGKRFAGFESTGTIYFRRHSHSLVIQACIPVELLPRSINLPVSLEALMINYRTCRYPWGTCHVMRPEHSDNTYLQCLLLEVGFQDMKREMRGRHEQFRQQQVRHVTQRQHRSRFVRVTFTLQLAIGRYLLTVQFFHGDNKATTGPIQYFDLLL